MIYFGGELTGFALINTHSYIETRRDYVLAEFTVFPIYRKKHIATEAVNKIFKMFSGSWEIKYNEKNTAAKSFWLKVTARYKPKAFHLNERETVLAFCV